MCFGTTTVGDALRKAHELSQVLGEVADEEVETETEPEVCSKEDETIVHQAIGILCGEFLQVSKLGTSVLFPYRNVCSSSRDILWVPYYACTMRPTMRVAGRQPSISSSSLKKLHIFLPFPDVFFVVRHFLIVFPEISNLFSALYPRPCTP